MKDTINRLHEWANLTDAELRLRCGELTAQEIRTVRAVLSAILGQPSEVKPKPNQTVCAEAVGSAWQCTDTAPKNISVLVYIPNAEHYGDGIYRAILVDMGTGKRWMTTGLHFGRDCGASYLPTHWMPLPASPNDQAQPRAEKE